MPPLPVGPLRPQSVEDSWVSARAVELGFVTHLPPGQPFTQLGFSVEREEKDEGEQDCRDDLLG